MVMLAIGLYPFHFLLIELVNTPLGDTELSPVGVERPSIIVIENFLVADSSLGKHTQVALPVSGPEVDMGYPPPVQLQDFVLAKVEGLPYQNGTNLSNT
jgi:hypothetical protein